MIKRLKRRFMIVNMSILTCVLFSIIVSVFAMMYSSEVELSNEIMESIMSQKQAKHDEFFSESEASISKEAYNISLLNNDYNLYNNQKDFEYIIDEPKLPPDFPKDDYDDDYKNDDIYDDDRFPPPMEEPKHSDVPLPSPPPPAKQTTADNTIKPEDETQVKVTHNASDESKPIVTQVTQKIEKTTNENPVNSEKVIENEKSKNDNNEVLVTKKYATSEKQHTTAIVTNTSVSSKYTEANTMLTSTVVPERPKEENNKPEPGKAENDPFKGKVKRSYVYVEFSDINDLEKMVYQYCTSENDDDIKAAVSQIFNNNKEIGKINIGNNKYRYMFRYIPPKMKYTIVMLDRTLEINTINRLLFIFTIIAGGGLIFIFLISFFLANWTIKPVEKAWAQQKEFIANASHELKTPLTVISTNTDLVLSYPDDKIKNQSKWLNYIKNETLRMSKLVNSLLSIAKYDANKVQIIYNSIDFSNLISSICLQYEPLIFENDKSLIMDIENNINLLGDEDKLKQVVNILMDNALKYSLENGMIKVSLKKIKQSVCLTVSNTSADIEKEQLEKIFDRFYRVDNSRNRKTGGSGLGLNIAKTIVESHKGTINAINKDNITSFIITF